MAEKTPVKKTTKPKKVATHPKYTEMVTAALGSLKERGGSSRQAILKYIMANFNVGADAKGINVHLKTALRNGVKKGLLKQSKGTGAAGSFKLGEQPKEKKPKAKKPTKPAAAKPKKPAAKKPAAKKTATGEKKTPAKKAKKPAAAKKPATKKTTKQPKTKTAKSPKKTKTVKPKKTKTPKKK